MQMGLWNFVKEAGSSWFGGKAKAETLPDAEAIIAGMEKIGLDTKGVDLKIEGDKVVVTGAAVSPEMKEKIILAAGNVEGVAAVEADVDGPAPRFHVVKKGDTLSAISQATLGKASRYNEIFEANRPMLSHPDKIYPGQTLRIPQK
jgi:nucleoid-associated protein YgaU